MSSSVIIYVIAGFVLGVLIVVLRNIYRKKMTNAQIHALFNGISEDTYYICITTKILPSRKFAHVVGKTIAGKNAPVILYQTIMYNSFYGRFEEDPIVFAMPVQDFCWKYEQIEKPDEIF